MNVQLSRDERKREEKKGANWKLESQRKKNDHHRQNTSHSMQTNHIQNKEKNSN